MHSAKFEYNVDKNLTKTDVFNFTNLTYNTHYVVFYVAANDNPTIWP